MWCGVLCDGFGSVLLCRRVLKVVTWLTSGCRLLRPTQCVHAVRASLACHKCAVSLGPCKTDPPPIPPIATPYPPLQVVGIMQQEGIAPDVITYNSLLKAAAAGGLLGEARRLYSELLQAGLAPSTFTYAALFSAAARARSSDAAWLLQVGRLRTARVEAHTQPGHALRMCCAEQVPFCTG